MAVIQLDVINSKVCAKCKVEKPESEFNKKTKSRLQPYCRPCDNAMSRARYKKNPDSHKEAVKERNRRYRKEVQDYLRDLKESTPCKDCGENYPYYVMDFDHLRDKKGNLAQMHANTMKVIKEEIAKCEIVCANCHRERTYNKNNLL